MSERGQGDEAREYPGKGDTTSKEGARANVSAWELWADWRTGRGLISRSEHKAFLAGVAAADRTNALVKERDAKLRTIETELDNAGAPLWPENDGGVYTIDGRVIALGAMLRERDATIADLEGRLVTLAGETGRQATIIASLTRTVEDLTAACERLRGQAPLTEGEARAWERLRDAAETIRTANDHEQGRRDRLGRIVREEWIAWAKEQPTPKPSWLVPWEGLSEPDREVDRRIGARLFSMGVRAALDLVDDEHGAHSGDPARLAPIARAVGKLQEAVADAVVQAVEIDHLVHEAGGPWALHADAPKADPLAPDPEDGTLCADCRAPRNAIHSPLCSVRAGARPGRMRPDVLASTDAGNPDDAPDSVGEGGAR